MPELAQHADQANKKRRRPPLSCEQCRKRKVKCNRNYPCNNCVKSKTETCTYAPAHTPKVRKKGAGAGAGARASTPQPPASSSPGTPSSLRPAAGTAPLNMRPRARAAQIQTPESDLFHRTSVWQPLRSSSASRAASRAGQSVPPNNQERTPGANQTHSPPPPQENRPSQFSPPAKGSISKGRYFGQTHWMNIAGSFSVELSMMKSQENTQSELFQVLYQCKRICQDVKTSRLPPLASSDLGKTAVSRELSDELVNAYLRTFEGVYRVLHVPTFRQEYAAYWENPSEASEAFLVLLQLCMVLGTSIRESSVSLKAIAIRWIYEAQMWIMLPPEKSRMTLTGIQIMCLLTLAKMTCGVSADLTWVLAGSLVRTAMYIGLHRDPSHISEMTVYKAEMRRRLWATIMELNLQYAFEAGGMPLISCDDYDTLPPADLDDDKLDDSIDDVSNRITNSAVATQSSVLLQVYKSFPVRLKLLQYTNDFRVNFNYDETLRLNSELTMACRSFTQTISGLARRPDGTSTVFDPEWAGPITSFHISLAEVTLYRCFHALHFPVLFTSFDDPKFYFSRKMCLDGALKIADLWGFSRPSQRSSSNNRSIQSDFDRLAINGTGMFRNIPTQAVCIIALELIQDKGGPGPSGPGGGGGCLPTAGNAEMRASLDEALNWVVARMRAGELTAKAHSFLSACIAHTEALERGMDKRATMALLVQRATEAAREDLAILKNVALESGVPVVEPQRVQGAGGGSGDGDGGGGGGGSSSGGGGGGFRVDESVEALAAGWDGNWSWYESADWLWDGNWPQLNVPMPMEDVNQFFAPPVGYPR